MKKNHGFTLIELLVSMSLLAMIVLVGSSAFGLFAQRWDGRLGHFDDLMQNARNVLLAQQALDRLVPYVAHDHNGKPIIYFEGNRNGFVAVSTKSLFSDGDFAVVRLSAKQNSDLTFDIVFEEWAMNRKMLVSTDQQLNFSRPLILFSSVKQPTFNYFGWSDIRERSSPDEGIVTPPYWSDRYDGVKALFAPLKVDLSFDSVRGPYRMVSTIMTQKPGLVSRYKTRPNNPLDEELQPLVDDDCFC